MDELKHKFFKISYDCFDNPVSIEQVDMSEEMSGYALYASCFDRNGLQDFIEISRSKSAESLESLKRSIEYFLNIVSFKRDFTTRSEFGNLVTVPNAFRITGYGISLTVEPIL